MFFKKKPVEPQYITKDNKLVGVKMGENMEAFKHIWHKFDVAIVSLCIVLGVAYLYKHFKHLKD